MSTRMSEGRASAKKSFSDSENEEEGSSMMMYLIGGAVAVIVGLLAAYGLGCFTPNQNQNPTKEEWADKDEASGWAKGKEMCMKGQSEPKGTLGQFNKKTNEWKITFDGKEEKVNKDKLDECVKEPKPTPEPSTPAEVETHGGWSKGQWVIKKNKADEEGELQMYYTKENKWGVKFGTKEEEKFTKDELELKNVAQDMQFKKGDKVTENGDEEGKEYTLVKYVSNTGKWDATHGGSTYYLDQKNIAKVPDVPAKPQGFLWTASTKPNFEEHEKDQLKAYRDFDAPECELQPGHQNPDIPGVAGWVKACAYVDSSAIEANTCKKFSDPSNDPPKCCTGYKESPMEGTKNWGGLCEVVPADLAPSSEDLLQAIQKLKNGVDGKTMRAYKLLPECRPEPIPEDGAGADCARVPPPLPHMDDHGRVTAVTVPLPVCQVVMKKGTTKMNCCAHLGQQPITKDSGNTPTCWQPTDAYFAAKQHETEIYKIAKETPKDKWGPHEDMKRLQALSEATEAKNRIMRDVANGLGIGSIMRDDDEDDDE